jgi:hypothetical protein
MKNKNYLVFIVYYIYALILIVGFMWAVIYKGLSGWWIILLLMLVNISPEMTSKSNNDNEK